MRKMNLFLLAIVVLCVGQLQPHTIQALSCVEIPDIEEAYGKYDGVVVGYVNGLDEGKNHNEIKITVDRSFKGINEESITFQEDKTWGNLNGPSEVGEQYLFFLQMNDGNWENPLCSPSMKAADAFEELVYLQDKEIQFQQEGTSTETHEDAANGEESTSETGPEVGRETESISWLVVISLACLILAILIGVIRMNSEK